jgi:hypothetical protein
MMERSNSRSRNRLARRLSRGTAIGLSSALLIVTVTACALSPWQPAGFVTATQWHVLSGVASPYGLRFAIKRFVPRATPPSPAEQGRLSLPLAHSGHRRWSPWFANEYDRVYYSDAAMAKQQAKYGLSRIPCSQGAEMEYLAFALPIFVPIILFGTYPALALVYGPVRRRHRRARNQCVRCGYDLTGLVATGCPECGAERVAASAGIAG